MRSHRFSPMMTGLALAAMVAAGTVEVEDARAEVKAINATPEATPLTPTDLERLRLAEVKRARKAAKLRASTVQP